MQNQLENDINKTLEGLKGIANGIEKFLSETKNNLQTPEEKKKFAEAMEKSNIMKDFKKVTDQFKDVLK